MTRWVILVGAIYVAILFFLSLRSKRKSKNAEEFTTAGRSIGLILGFMSFAAALFSTFTLMGMPDFVRINGVGSWIFLGVSDAGMVFLIVWFGFELRKKVTGKGFNGMSELLQQCYQNRWAGLLYFAGVFIFLVPYVAIQIRGISVFLVQAFPHSLPAWGWSISILVFMLLYSAFGGLKAVLYADFIQGAILLVVVWVVAFSCARILGGFNEVFTQTETINPALLSVPGPKGLFTTQFLVASFLAILMIPVTQPHLSSRLIVMKNTHTLRRMTVAVGTFALLVIFPTILIGLYGAIKYPKASMAEYLGKALLYDQTSFVAAAAIIGLLAAGMSTSDSQLFALGNELRGLLGKRGSSLFATRMTLVLFALCSLAFSLISSDQLVMLARVSFTGTALMGPLVIVGILSNKPKGKWMLYLTALGLVTYLLSLIKLIPDQLGPVRLDLFLFTVISLTFAIQILKRK